MGGDRVRDVDGIEMMTIITCFDGLRGKNIGDWWKHMKYYQMCTQRNFMGSGWMQTACWQESDKCDGRYVYNIYYGRYVYKHICFWPGPCLCDRRQLHIKSNTAGTVKSETWRNSWLWLFPCFNLSRLYTSYFVKYTVMLWLTKVTTFKD